MYRLTVLGVTKKIFFNNYNIFRIIMNFTHYLYITVIYTLWVSVSLALFSLSSVNCGKIITIITNKHSTSSGINNNIIVNHTC